MIAPNTIRLADVYQYKVTSTKHGGMACVFLAERDGYVNPFELVFRRRLAIKTFRDDIGQGDMLFERELNLWLELNYKYVVPLLLVTQIEGRLAAIMPAYDCSLHEFIREHGALSAQQTAQVLMYILRCLEDVFRVHGVVHLDLKPANILIISQGHHREFHISDWAIASLQASRASSCNLPTQYAHTMSGFGTLAYMSPERLSGARTHVQSDIYAVGMMCVEMLSGRLPYDLQQPIYEQIITGAYYERAAAYLSSFPGASQLLAEFALRALEPDLRHRLASYKECITFLKRSAS